MLAGTRDMSVTEQRYQAVLDVIGEGRAVAGSAIDPGKIFNFVHDPALPPQDFDANLR